VIGAPATGSEAPREQPLAGADPRVWRSLRAVLADIDDTLTTEGKLTGVVFGSLERLQKAGLLVVPVTGRPAGWCDHIARMWPADAVVGENGAFWFRYDRATRKMIRRFVQGEAERAANRERLSAVAEGILREVPGSAVAADQAYRETDLAIDYCEDVPRLPQAAVERIIAIMEEAGLTAKASSIHVNGWFGRYDKLSTSILLAREAFGIDLDAWRARFAFVGDSPNDEPMFRFFPHAVGVANVGDFAGRLATMPAYVTQARGGAGFAEFAEAVLVARR
jgi:HAD superfamily hydrolase (TIGR01484 family)